MTRNGNWSGSGVYTNEDIVGFPGIDMIEIVFSVHGDYDAGCWDYPASFSENDRKMVEVNAYCDNNVVELTADQQKEIFTQFRDQVDNCDFDFDEDDDGDNDEAYDRYRDEGN
jgi:hypothetical protein